MNLLIVGAPGAGKGTVSESIVNNYGVTHVSTGDMLRNAIKQGSDIGKLAQQYIDKGQLVPDEVIHDIIVERLSCDDMKNGFLFDGYPRTLNQAIDLDNILQSLNMKIDCVLNLDICDDELIKRITGRRLCPKCGEIYNIYYSKTLVEGKCDECGGDLIKRNDDNEESLKVRLVEYHKNTQPVIGYYEKMGLVKNIDATLNKAGVYNKVKSILEGLQ